MNFLNKIENFKSNVCLINENKKYFSYDNVLSKSENLVAKIKSRSLILVLAENNVEFLGFEI